MVDLCNPGCSPFLDWMHRHFRGFYYDLYPCWNWRIAGVLVTFWFRTGIVKIYHDEGRATEWPPAETERCREAILALASRITVDAADRLCYHLQR